MRPEENHKFLVIETPWSVLFLNYVTSSFACPKKNKKQKSALDTEGFNESRLEVTRKLYCAATWNLQVFYPKLARDLWRMVVIFKFNKNTSIKCNEESLPYCTSSNIKAQLRSPAHSKPMRKATRQCRILVFLSFPTLRRKLRYQNLTLSPIQSVLKGIKDSPWNKNSPWNCSNFERGNLNDLLTILHCNPPLVGKWHAEDTITTHFDWKK